MGSILVLCTGNVCRSPIAEGFIKVSVERRFGDDAPSVSSAGTVGWEGSGAMPESIRAAAERGIDIGSHVAHRVTLPLIVEAELILTMAREHADAVAASVPEAAARTFTLKELVRLLEALPGPSGDGPEEAPIRVAAANRLRGSGFEGNPQDDDISDPLGLPFGAYRAIAWELDTWCERLADGLFGALAMSSDLEGGGG